MFFYNLYEHNINEKLLFICQTVQSRNFPSTFAVSENCSPEAFKRSMALLGYSEGIPEALQYRFNPLLFDESK